MGAIRSTVQVSAKTSQRLSCLVFENIMKPQSLLIALMFLKVDDTFNGLWNELSDRIICSLHMRQLKCP